jgi:hypothetical protein
MKTGLIHQIPVVRVRPGIYIGNLDPMKRGLIGGAEMKVSGRNYAGL